MKSLFLTILGIFPLPASALAHPGHVADHGSGHSHWGLYLLLACVLFGLALRVRAYLNGR